MNDYVNIFDGHIPYYKITKPIRLIELFAGIGSQHQALKNLGVKIDRSTIVEWQVNSIQAYNDIHIRKYDDWTKDMTKEELAHRLNELGVSLDYNQPAKLETLLRKGEDWLRNVYNNIINTNNKVNIMSVKASHLNITDTDKYDYILTYSFPCQDLSKAGKGRGMSDTTTRSGLLWEVERILSECEELPQVLLMENVPDVIGSRYISDFKRWDERLRELGYSNHIEILNSKDYGIPQNRERAFMVSILGDHLYNFPIKQPLKLRLKDMLETQVDEKYYLSEKILTQISNWNSYQNPLERTLGKESVSPMITTRIAESIDGGINASMLVVSQDLDKEKDTRSIFRSQDKRLPEMLDKIDLTSDEPQSLDLYNRTVSDISQTLTMPNHNAQAIAVKEPKLDVICNIQANGRENGNIYNSDGLSPTLLARDYKDLKKIIEPSLAIPEDTKKGYALANDGDGVVVKEENRFFEQAFKTLRENKVKIGDTINAFNEQVDTSGVSPTLTTRPEGFKTAILPVVNNLRIRKLTPRECYRLMGFSDQAFDLAQPNQSNSSLYHQAGDSIVVNVLMAIFKELL